MPETPIEAPILITGAGNGIGFYTACYLKKLGFSVIGHFHQTLSDKERFFSVCVDTFQADLRDDEAVSRLCSEISARHPALRGIIHNASNFSPMACEPKEAYEQFRSFVAVHMLAPFQINLRLQTLLLEYVENQKINAKKSKPNSVPSTLTHGLADIIHITDIYTENPNPQFANYCATKAGLENLSLSFAKMLAPNIKVNTIQPGPISFKPFHDEEKQASVINATLLERQGSPEAIAKAISCLLDNDYITGTRLQVDGGRHLTHG